MISAYVKNAKFWLNMLTPDFIKQKISNIGKFFEELGPKIGEMFDKGIKTISGFFEESVIKLKSLLGLEGDSKIVKIFTWLKEGIKNFLLNNLEQWMV